MSAIHQSVPLGPSPTINIRLLKVELDISHVTASSMISAQLHVTSLDDVPPYTAVSYVWGTPSPTKVILLNGQPFPVRQNLWNLLNQLRGREYGNHLWIDAISIDQTNDTEKSHQVAIMDSIYMRATTTIAWLGIPTEDVARDIQCLTSGFSKDKLASTDLSEHSVGLDYLLAHPYWTRTWILQEYVLSANVTLWCGNYILAAKALEWIAIQCIASTKYYDRGRLGTEAIILQAPSLRATVTSRSCDKTVNLNFLVLLTWETACADPRDRIYALLSLLSPQERELWAITPDYTKSAQALFEELCGKFQESKLVVARKGQTLEEWKEQLCHALLIDDTHTK